MSMRLLEHIGVSMIPQRKSPRAQNSPWSVPFPTADELGSTAGVVLGVALDSTTELSLALALAFVVVGSPKRLVI